MLKISDFCIAHNDIPKVIADRIYEHHLRPLERVNMNTPFQVFVSYSVKGQPSGWRPYAWELARGRSGRSEHTFGQREKVILESKGATDITCDNFQENKCDLLDALVEHTDYIRITEYETFFHCDYKNLEYGARRYFKVIDGKWVFQNYL